MTQLLSNSEGQLRSIVERIERLEEDKHQLTAELAYVYSEAKAQGFDAKIIRKLVALRKKEPAQRQEEETILGLYMAALGMMPEEEAA